MNKMQVAVDLHWASRNYCCDYLAVQVASKSIPNLSQSWQPDPAKVRQVHSADDGNVAMKETETTMITRMILGSVD